MATGDIYVWQEQASGKLQPIKSNGTASGSISLNPIPNASVSGLGSAALVASSTFATTAQGAKADSALQPGGSGTVSADTGWTGNTDTGSKSAVIPASATLTAMQAALNLVVAGFGDAFVATAAKVKALEAAGVAFKVPNA